MESHDELNQCEGGASASTSPAIQLQRSWTDPTLECTHYEIESGHVKDWVSESGIQCRQRCWKPLTREQWRAFAQTLASTLQTVPIKTPTQTFLCCICLENIEVINKLVMVNCGHDSHASCRNCLRHYLQLRIEENRVDELRCPCAGRDGCEGLATEEELQSWLTDPVFEKYRRFSRMLADPKLRSCPQCSRLCSPEVTDGGTVIAEMSCKDCGCNFCYHHSNVHELGPEACAEYERKMVKQQLYNDGLYGTKPCPSCGFVTEKVSGCNHMTCKCKVNWCWVCSKELDNVGWHYNPANPSGCMQFQGEMATGRNGKLMVLCKLLSLPAACISFLFFLLFVFCLVVTVPVLLCLCCKETGFKAWIGIAAILIGGPFAVFSLVWAVVGLIIWLFLKPCGVNGMHLQFLVGIPSMTILALSESLPGVGIRHQTNTANGSTPRGIGPCSVGP